MKVAAVGFGPFFLRMTGSCDALVAAGADGEVIADEIGIDPGKKGVPAEGIIPGNLFLFFFRKPMVPAGLVVSDLIAFIISEAGEIAGAEHAIVERICRIEAVLKTAIC